MEKDIQPAPEAAADRPLPGPAAVTTPSPDDVAGRASEAALARLQALAARVVPAPAEVSAAGVSAPVAAVPAATEVSAAASVTAPAAAVPTAAAEVSAAGVTALAAAALAPAAPAAPAAATAETIGVEPVHGSSRDETAMDAIDAIGMTGSAVDDLPVEAPARLLVWPPPDDELDDWHVIALRAPEPAVVHAPAPSSMSGPASASRSMESRGALSGGPASAAPRSPSIDAEAASDSPAPHASIRQSPGPIGDAPPKRPLPSWLVNHARTRDGIVTAPLDASRVGDAPSPQRPIPTTPAAPLTLVRDGESPRVAGLRIALDEDTMDLRAPVVSAAGEAVTSVVHPAVSSLSLERGRSLEDQDTMDLRAPIARAPIVWTAIEPAPNVPASLPPASLLPTPLLPTPLLRTTVGREGRTDSPVNDAAMRSLEDTAQFEWPVTMPTVAATTTTPVSARRQDHRGDVRSPSSGSGGAAAAVTPVAAHAAQTVAPSRATALVPTAADAAHALVPTATQAVAIAGAAGQIGTGGATSTARPESFARRAAVIVLALLAVGQSAYIGARLLLTPASAAPPAVLIVESMPSGADVLVDGQRMGTTPFRAELSPGAHVLELRRNGRSRSLPLTLAAGIQASQYVELGATPTRSTQGDPNHDRASTGTTSGTPGDPGTPGSTSDAGRTDASRPNAGDTSGGSATDASAGAASAAATSPNGAAPTTPAGATVTSPPRDASASTATTSASSSPASPATSPATSAATTGAATSGSAGNTSDGSPASTAPATRPSTPAAAPAASRGWVNVDSPITLSVLRNGELLGNSDEGRLQLPAGRQELDLVNDSVGYRATMAVQVTAGRETSLPVELPQSTINISATPSAIVWVDGREVGSAPISQLALPVGTHEVRFRHPELGERRVTVTVRVGVVAHASVDFTAR